MIKEEKWWLKEKTARFQEEGFPRIINFAEQTPMPVPGTQWVLGKVLRPPAGLQGRGQRGVGWKEHPNLSLVPLALRFHLTFSCLPHTEPRSPRPLNVSPPPNLTLTLPFTQSVFLLKPPFWRTRSAFLLYTGPQLTYLGEGQGPHPSFPIRLLSCIVHPFPPAEPLHLICLPVTLAEIRQSFA